MDPNEARSALALKPELGDRNKVKMGASNACLSKGRREASTMIGFGVRIDRASAERANDLRQRRVPLWRVCWAVVIKAIALFHLEFPGL